MKIVIEHNGVKREIDGAFSICASAAEFISIRDQVHAGCQENFSYGWVSFRTGESPGAPNTAPLPWAGGDQATHIKESQGTDQEADTGSTAWQYATWHTYPTGSSERRRELENHIHEVSEYVAKAITKVPTYSGFGMVCRPAKPSAELSGIERYLNALMSELGLQA